MATVKVGQFVEQGGYKKSGSSVSVTFSMDATVSPPVMDTEILIPLDRDFTPPDGCTRKPLIKLVNAVKIRHEGNPAALQATCGKLTEYIQAEGLTAITPAYIATVKDVLRPEDINQAVMDVYVGISPNVL